MFQSKWRLWNISISMLAILTGYNIFLTVKLMYSNPPATCPKIIETVEVPKIPEEPPPHERCQSKVENNTHSLNLNLRLSRYDAKLSYKLYDYIIVGEQYVKLNGLYQTCLATQSSLEKIASLIESTLYWGGPISLAAFAPTETDLNNLLLYIVYLRKCNKRIKEKVTFHLAVPADKPFNDYKVDEEQLGKMSCENPMGVLKNLVKSSNKRVGIDAADVLLSKQVVANWRSSRQPYPQNLLRNLARKNCQTKYVFLTDVDIIPSRGMAENLNEFLKTVHCSGKCAYVVPTYELDERVFFPPNKTDLIRMANKGLARPFHHKVFIYNQYATNFTRWQNYKDPDNQVRISHPVTNFEFLYEPFYIATDNVPPHDERFVGYGYTRNSQVYEMFVAGYEFYVLSPIFTCHWGLQVKKTRPPWREHQNNMNRKQFDQFKKEIFAKYNKDPLNMIKH